MELLCCPWFSGLCACFLCSLSLSLSLSLWCALLPSVRSVFAHSLLAKSAQSLSKSNCNSACRGAAAPRSHQVQNPASMEVGGASSAKTAGFQWVWWGWPDLGWARLGWPGAGPKCCRFGIFEFMPKSNFSMAKAVVAHGLSLCLCGPGHSFDGFSTSTFLGEEISEASVWGPPTLSKHLSWGGGTLFCAV